MELRPILSALYRNKVGAALIALQITLTLAVLCNASFIVRQKLTQMSRPSGLDETDTFIIDNQWIGKADDLASRVRTDLSALRSLPGVAGAYVTNAYPFENGGWGFGFSLHPDGKQETGAAVYLGDEQALRTLGLKLVAGRNFNADDIVDYHGITDRPATSGMIITRALAEQLFHGGNALGKQVTMIPTYQSAPVVGIIDKLQAPWVAAVTGPDAERAALLPYRFVSQGSFYVVRARPGQVSAMMKAARDTLLTVSRGRVIGKIQSLAQARHDAERNNRAPVIMLTLVSVSLLAVTAFGIVGLVSFWVMQRRRQIGVRRALGATRLAIVRHFQAENLLITAAGAVVGVALAVGANLWMVSSFSMQRLPIGYLIAGVAVLVALGQLAVLWPALRAASVPPAVATRTI